MPTKQDRLSPPPPPPSSDFIATDNDPEEATMDLTNTTLVESTTLHNGTKNNETEANPFLRSPKRLKIKL